MLFNIYIVWLAINTISIAIFSITCIKWQIDRIWGKIYGGFFLTSTIGLMIASYGSEGAVGMLIVGLLVTVMTIAVLGIRSWLGATTQQKHK